MVWGTQDHISWRVTSDACSSTAADGVKALEIQSESIFPVTVNILVMVCNSVFDLMGKKRKNFNPSEALPASSPSPCPPTHLPMLSLLPGRAVLTTQRPFPLCFLAVSTKLVGGKDQSWNLCWHYLEPSSTSAFSAKLHGLRGQQDGAMTNRAAILPPSCHAVWQQMATCHNTWPGTLS